jgi:hypothetical protein
MELGEKSKLVVQGSSKMEFTYQDLSEF